MSNLSVSRSNVLYQASLMSALLSGVYEGDTTMAQLREHGDFGLGTFNKLDGELIAFDGNKSGYAKLQGTRPQTIGYALADSPVAQAAWIYEKLGEWTDSGNDPESVLTRDEILDNISLYWLTDSGASSARLYAESFTTDFSTQKLDLPVAVSLFPRELYHPPRKWAERTYSKLYYWNEAARGGHFAAFEQPTLFTAELRRAFATVR